jgi:hypothetical protein
LTVDVDPANLAEMFNPTVDVSLFDAVLYLEEELQIFVFIE